MATYCPECGKPLPYNSAKFCLTCGAPVQRIDQKFEPSPALTPPVFEEPKSDSKDVKYPKPWIAAVLGLFYPGWGQWYNGRRWDGVAIFGGALLFVLLGGGSGTYSGLNLVVFAISLYGAAEAYSTAKKINSKELEYKPKSRLFWLPIGIWILILIAFIFGALMWAL
jgi:hypothetical protein